MCGCEWDYEFSKCMAGQPFPCSTHTNPNDCEDCGCIWEEPESKIKVNVTDAWRNVNEIKINIGDVWKTVTAVYINIGDTWKQVWP